ncbi:MAG: BMC domain-containing protein [Deltaproteobacteria bacterium]|nr:BMC domain-containing protein [Deltaproteobacteria bacterium]
MTATAPHEALALLEIEGLPRAIRAQDAALKRAATEVLACTPLSPGKAVLILAGSVAAVEESLAAAEAVVGNRRLDRLFLPGVHQDLLGALRGARGAQPGEALAILEMQSLAATLEAADAALKTAAVNVGRLHLGAGFGGKGYFTLTGALAEVEAGVAAALQLAGERALDHEIIAAPHEELEAAAFVRCWPLDPADCSNVSGAAKSPKQE